MEAGLELTILHLPSDIIFDICTQYLETKDVFMLGSTCKQLREYCLDTHVLAKKFKQDVENEPSQPLEGSVIRHGVPVNINLSLNLEEEFITRGETKEMIDEFHYIPHSLLGVGNFHTDEVLYLSISNSGKYLVSSSRDCYIAVWKVLDFFNSNENSPISPLWSYKDSYNLSRGVFSPDEKYVIVSRVAGPNNNEFDEDDDEHKFAFLVFNNESGELLMIKETSPMFDCYPFWINNHVIAVPVYSSLRFFRYSYKLIMYDMEKINREEISQELKILGSSSMIRLMESSPARPGYFTGIIGPDPKILGFFEQTFEIETETPNNNNNNDNNNNDNNIVNDDDEDKNDKMTEVNKIEVIKLVKSIELTGFALGTQYSRDGKYYLLYLRRLISEGRELSSEGDIHLWSVTTHQLLRSFSGPKANTVIYCPFIIYMDCSFGMRYVTCGDEVGDIFVWYSETGKLIKKWRGHDNVVNRVLIGDIPSDVTFLQSKFFIASCSDDFSVKVWAQ